MSEAKKPNLVSRLRRKLGPKSADLEETLETVIETHAEETGNQALAGDARSMVRNVIGFADLRVKDVMVPRVNIVAVAEDTTLRALLDQFIEANHSRLPVFRENLDDVIGMVHVKDFLRWLTSRGKKKRVKTAKESGLTLAARELSQPISDLPNLRREVLFVPPSMPAPDLLLKMKADHIHLAIVVDEYGGTDGLVSLEDLVEQIIGDISDEHDSDEDSRMLTKVDDENYIANAQVEIAALDQALGVKLQPEGGEDEAKTLAGLISEMSGRVPIRGEIIRHPLGPEFEIIDSDARRIRRVRIHFRKVKPASPAKAKAEAHG